jgi:two-component system, chemotaxis family, sensor kinase CheA
VTERVDLQEFIGAFIVEAAEIVATANASLLEIEVANGEGTSRPRAVRDLFRALHTVKGLASMIGVEPIVEIAHALETLLRAADRAGGTLRHAAVEIALQGVAAISERVRAVAEHRAVAEAPARLIEAIAHADAGPDAPIVEAPIPGEWALRLSPGERHQLAQALQTRTPVWTLSFTPSAANASRKITIATVRAGLDAIGEVIKVIPRATAATAPDADDPHQGTGVAFDILIVSTATEAAIASVAATDPERVLRVVLPATGPAAARPAAIDVAGSTVAPFDPTLDPTLDPIERDDLVSPVGRAVVRVELSRLDDLQDQLSLLIVSRFRLDREIAALAELGHDVRRLREVAQLQGRQLRDLRRAILRARMVRVAEVLEPLTLLVRSLARSSQRAVQLELDACDVELDKAVADRLLPALIHLVRNAVDHAIEPPDHRVAIGKVRTGTVRVSCIEVAGNHVQIVVSDDGCGVDRAAIARRANRPIDGDASLLQVLTSPGFSTREVATTTSGRGLGMDIVRRIAVGNLGGTLSMTTQPGRGTAFTLRIPVTIAVMDVFSFQCGPQSFVVPAVAVEEIFELQPELLVVPPIPHAGSAIAPLSLVEHRGHAIPVVSLGAILAIDSGARARKALVVQRNDHRIAFTVDRVIGRQEVVVRTIDDPLVAVPGIAGATDLGDGRPTLVLDLNELGIIARERAAS